MKAKAIRKRLMLGRVESFWGRRAYFTVRVPLSAYPEPLPPGLKIDGYHAAPIGWESDDGTRLVRVGKIHCAGPPRPENCAHLIERDDWGWTWWEAREYAVEGEERSVRDLGEEAARAVRDRDAWIDRWVHGHGHPTGCVLPDALIEASFHAKTVYEREVDGALLLTYSVKWAYPDRKIAFCSAMARAFRVAKERGIDLRWVRQ